MNRLPKVLQNEIWEYVHGDRAYWKTQFTNVMEQLEETIDATEDDLFDRVVQPTPNSRAACLVKYAKAIVAGCVDSMLQWRKYLSRRGHPMYIDSRAEHLIHRREFSRLWKIQNSMPPV